MTDKVQPYSNDQTQAQHSGDDKNIDMKDVNLTSMLCSTRLVN